MIKVESAKELLEVGEIVDVRFFKFSAAIREEPREDLESDDVVQNLNVLVGTSEKAIELRLEISIDTRTAEYSGTAAMQFKFQEEVEFEEEVGKEFAERVGVMAVYPYLRELIQTSSVRLREDVVTIPLLRAGQTSLTRSDDELDG